MRPGGATDLVKIVDFGIAKQAESSDEEAAGRGRRPGKGKFEFALTAPGAVMGTPSYLSPEQARSEAVSAVADQYSLGCILYEMVTGAVPFAATGLIELLEKHISQPPPPLSTAERPTPKPVPRRLEALVQRLLAKEPKARFPSMREVASALEAILAELSAAAAPVRPLPLARGYRWAALAAAAALLVGGVVLVTRPHPQTAPARPPLSAAELASLHQRSLAALKADLHSGQMTLRLGAVSALGQVRAREARPELASLLKDRDASVQALAAHALAQLGDPSGRQYLEQELAASSPERQLQAALLLCDQDSPIAQRQLWDLVQNNKVPEPVWLDAVTCLAQSSQPLLARAKLAERWRSLGSGAGQDAARIPVAARLVQLGDEGARSYLRGLVSPRRPGSAQLAAARALAAPDEPEAAALFRRVLGSQLAETAARLLASEGLGLSGDLLDLRLLAPALEPAVAPELRQAAATAILRLWATDPAALSAESLTWARSALSDASWAMRVAAVEVLEGSPAPGAVALLSGLLHDPDQRVRRHVVRALGRRPERAALLAFQTALTDEDRGVRSEALQALRHLLRRLGRHDLDELRASIQSWLARLLVDATGAQQIPVRSLLLQLGDESQRPLLAAWEKSAEPEPRRLLIEESEPRRAWLLASLGDGDWSVRFAAARRLAATPGEADAQAQPQLRAVLREALQRGGVDSLIALALLRRLGEAVTAQERLLEALRLSAPVSERLLAVEAGGRLASAEAIAVLLQAARDPEPLVRRLVAETAAELPAAADGSSGAVVLRVLVGDRDPAVRARAAALLARMTWPAGLASPPSPAGESLPAAARPSPEPQTPPTPPTNNPTDGGAAEDALPSEAAEAAEPSGDAAAEQVERAFHAGAQAVRQGDAASSVRLLSRARLLCARERDGAAAEACARLAPEIGTLLGGIFAQQKRWPEAMTEYQKVVHGSGRARPSAQQRAEAQRAIVRLGLNLGQVVIRRRQGGACKDEIHWVLPGVVSTVRVDGRSEQVQLQEGEVRRLGECN